MNIFLKALKFEAVLFEWAPMVFTFFSCLFMKDIQNEVSACEIPSSYPLQRACSGFLIADCAFKSCPRNLPVILKIVPKAGMYTRKNWPMRAKESLNRNLIRLSEQIWELVSVFNSVLDPWHFGADPDPRIHTSDYWIRIRILLLSSLTLRM